MEHDYNMEAKFAASKVAVVAFVLPLSLPLIASQSVDMDFGSSKQSGCTGVGAIYIGAMMGFVYTCQVY